MNIIYNILNEATSVIYKLNQNDITRCPHCNLIYSLKLNYKEGNPIIDYECENEHKGNIYLKEYISISYDKTMKIWQLNNENKYELLLTIAFQDINSWCNILKLNENEFVTSSTEDKCIKFWNSNNYSNILTIKNIELEWTLKTMCLLEDDILCVGGCNLKGFYLFKISTHQFIINIIGPKTIYAINKCLDGIFLCSIIDEKGNHCLVKYKYEEQKQYKIKKNIFKSFLEIVFY